MGDRTYARVTCREVDRPKFEELGYEVDETEDKRPGLATMHDYQANYGGERPNDLIYVGYHDNGAEYDACEFVCDGKTLMEVTVERDSVRRYVVSFDENGEPEPKSLQQIKDFFNLVAKVEKRLEQTSKRAAARQNKTATTIKENLHDAKM